MNINGTDIAVEVDGDGPALLFIHGLGGTSNFFQIQAQVLSEQFKVIRIDSAGAGRSGLAQDITIRSHADDAAAVLDALEVESASVVAHSMGTLVARLLAVRRPQLVSKLALLGAVRELTDGLRKAQRDRAATLRAGGIAQVAGGVVANALSESTRQNKPEVAAFVRELIMRQDPEGYARNCEALANATDPGPVDGSLPLLLITGTEDKVGPPEASQEIAGRHGNAVVELIDGIGHWTALEAAERTTELITKFV